jgi:regulator of protease activity HflC (stomatin/prohibitin superfamily)
MAFDLGLGWITDIVRYAGSWLPHPLKVLATHKAVKFRYGRRVVVLDAGFYWYMPAVTEVYQLPVVEQTDDLPVQCSCTKDLKTVAVGGTICYTIDDIRKAIVACFEITHVIRDRSLAIYNEFIADHTLAEILGGADDGEEDSDPGSRLPDEDTKPRARKSGRQRVNTALTRRLRSCLRPYGVDVLRAQLTNFAPCTALVHVGQAVLPASVASPSPESSS